MTLHLPFVCEEPGVGEATGPKREGGVAGEKGRMEEGGGGGKSKMDMMEDDEEIEKKEEEEEKEEEVVVVVVVVQKDGKEVGSIEVGREEPPAGGEGNR